MHYRRGADGTGGAQRVAERSVDLESAEVSVATRKVNLDEGARPDTTVQTLGKLKPVFAARGSVRCV